MYYVSMCNEISTSINKQKPKEKKNKTYLKLNQINDKKKLHRYGSTCKI